MVATAPAAPLHNTQVPIIDGAPWPTRDVWLCNAAPGCDEPAVTQWAYPIADEQAVSQVAAIAAVWADVGPGDTVPVFACQAHAPEGTVIP